MKQIPVIVVLALLLGSCAGPRQQQEGHSSARPSWMENAPRQYQAEFYFTAVGEGEKRSDAENRARAGIGMIIRSSVKATTQTKQKETMLRTGTEGTSELREESRQDITVETDLFLQGIEIVSVWIDPATNKTYAFAVLDRVKEAGNLRTKIVSLDESILALREKETTQSDNVELLKSKLLRRSLMAQRARLNEDLRVIDPAGKAVDPPADFHLENEAIASFLRTGIKLGITASGASGSSLAHMLADSLSANGLPVRLAAVSDPLDIRITVEMIMQTSEKPVSDNWHETQWEFKVNVQKDKGGTSLYSNSRRNRSRQLSATDAERRALLDASRTMNGWIRDIVLSITGS